MTHKVCVIADIVGSRSIEHRERAQEVFEHAFMLLMKDLEGSAESVPMKPWATFGDEFQFVCKDFDTALRATTLVMLNLAGEVSQQEHLQDAGSNVGWGTLALRFGLGEGEPGSAIGTDKIFAGNGWVNAWAAIEIAQETSKS